MHFCRIIVPAYEKFSFKAFECPFKAFERTFKGFG